MENKNKHFSSRLDISDTLVKCNSEPYLTRDKTCVKSMSFDLCNVLHHT